MVASTKTSSKIDLGPGRSGYLWETLDGDDVGSVVTLPVYDKLMVQIGCAGGNTHGGATTVMQGSMDAIAAVTPASAIWFTLTEKDNSAAISRTTTEILKEVKEHPLYIRPYQTGGTAGDMDIIAVVT